MRRIPRCALLAPDVVEAILCGRVNRGLLLENLERPLPASWEAQLEHLRREPVTSKALYRFVGPKAKMSPPNARAPRSADDLPASAKPQRGPTTV